MKLSKSKSIALVCGACLLSTSVFAATATCTGIPYLNMTCGVGTLPNLNGIIITLNGTTIEGQSTVYGKLELNQGATLKGGLQIGGVLIANDSTIEGTTKIGSTSVTLSNTKTSTLNITPEGTPAKVTLENGTVVSGNVVFGSGNGIVYEDSSSSITGKVIGGKIVHS